MLPIIFLTKKQKWSVAQIEKGEIKRIEERDREYCKTLFEKRHRIIYLLDKDDAHNFNKDNSISIAEAYLYHCNRELKEHGKALIKDCMFFVKIEGNENAYKFETIDKATTSFIDDRNKRLTEFINRKINGKISENNFQDIITNIKESGSSVNLSEEGEIVEEGTIITGQDFLNESCSAKEQNEYRQIGQIKKKFFFLGSYFNELVFRWFYTELPEKNLKWIKHQLGSNETTKYSKRLAESQEITYAFDGFLYKLIDDAIKKIEEDFKKGNIEDITKEQKSLYEDLGIDLGEKLKVLEEELKRKQKELQEKIGKDCKDINKVKEYDSEYIQEGPKLRISKDGIKNLIRESVLEHNFPIEKGSEKDIKVLNQHARIITYTYQIEKEKKVIRILKYNKFTNRNGDNLFKQIHAIEKEHFRGKIEIGKIEEHSQGEIQYYTRQEIKGDSLQSYIKNKKLKNKFGINEKVFVRELLNTAYDIDNDNSKHLINLQLGNIHLIPKKTRGVQSWIGTKLESAVEPIFSDFGINRITTNIEEQIDKVLKQELREYKNYVENKNKK